MSDTSNITPGDIDVDYPVAGVDNDTQGFRENFTAIRDSLTGTAGYIATLQDTTAVTNAANNFQGNNIVNANLIQVRHGAQVGAVPNTTTTKTLDYVEAAHFNLDFSVNTTVQIRNLPGDGTNTQFSKMTLVFKKAPLATVDPVITFDFAANNQNFYDDGNAIWSNFELDDASTHIMIELMSYDGGVNIYGKLVGSFSV